MALPAFLGAISGGAGAAASSSTGRGLLGGISGLINLPKVLDTDADRLADLQRRAALGELGLSDAEIAGLRDTRLAPIQAAQRSYYRDALANASLNDVGGGAMFKANQAQQQQAAQALDPGLRDIASADARAAAAQQAEMRKLDREIESTENERKSQRLDSIVSIVSGGVASGLSAAGALSDQQLAAKERETAADEAAQRAVDEILGEVDEDTGGDYNAFYENYGNL